MKTTLRYNLWNWPILFLVIIFTKSTIAQPVSWTIMHEVGDNTFPPPPTVGLRSIAYNPLNNNIYVYGQEFFNLPAQPSGMVYTKELGVIRYNNTSGATLGSVYDVHHDNTTLIPRSDEAGEMAIASDGSVYVTGKRYFDGTYLYDMVIIKYNSSLVEQWRYYAYSPGAADDAGIAIAVDHTTGNVFATGQIGDNGTGTGTDFVTIKIKPNGTLGWKRVYNTAGSHANTPTDITTDASGNVYVTGYSGSGSTGNQYTLIKYNSSGTRQWTKYYNAVTNAVRDDKANSVAVSTNGNVYITGTSENGTGNTDIVTVAYNAAGTKLWVKKINNSGDSRDRGFIVKTDASQNIYVGGDVDKDASSIANGDLIYLKYDPFGNTLLTKKYISGYNCEFGDLAVTTTGPAYMTGWCLGATIPPSNGSYSLMTIKYDASGVFQWADLLTPSQFQTCGEGYYGFKLATNTTTSEVAVGGRHWLSCPGAHPNELLVRRYNPTLRDQEEISIENTDPLNFEVYPNPISNDFFIKMNRDTYETTVVNVHGQIVYQNKSHNKTSRIISSAWARGIYLITVQSDGSFINKKIIKE